MGTPVSATGERPKRGRAFGMKMRARNVAWLLPFLLSGCFHLHKAQPQQDQLFAPPLANLPKPPLLHPELSESAIVIPDQPLETDVDMEQEPIPAKRRKPAKPSQQASNTPPAPDESIGVSAIGQLSSGEPSDLRRETDESIVATEHGLNGLNRSLSDQEKKTAEQIREYIKKAREALNSGDVDGAHTLAAKAKVLLSELNQ
jgi:hypothetical protein